ncbi:histone deacetylase 4-like isoform X2 [Artemia franciscana]|uniref:histone deacetylase 4-like isoform X2 n=1 Tax=Artemia franciscana TaxID=6661 RepID=UPI0032DAE977
MFTGSMFHQRFHDLNRHSPVSSPVVTRHPPDVIGGMAAQGPSLMLHEQALQQQLIQLKHQQHIQQQILLQQFQSQQQQLAEQHEKQLQLHMREYLEQQKRLEDEVRVDKERKDKERLEQIKKKEKHEQSAVASSEVKQKLQEFVLSKKQREACGTSSASCNSSTPSRTWNGATLSLAGPLAGSAPDPASGPSSSHAAFPPPHSFRHPLVPGKYEEDFPLRKTVSEPNLKMRMRRMFERRSSPLVVRAKRPHPNANGVQRFPLGNEEESRTSESRTCSPSSSAANLHSSVSALPVSEENNSQYSHLLASQGSIPDLTLYTSPSLPNISLGRPAMPSTSALSDSRLSEAEMRAAFAARLATMSLPGQVLPGSLPFYPPLSMLDPDFGSNPSSPGYIQKQMAALEQVRNFPQTQAALLASGIFPGITDAQVAQARLSKGGLRPFGRTQSAPLPLGHPLLQAAPLAPGLPFSREQFEQYLRECQLHDQQHQHYLLKQHIRQTVLTRTGSRSHVENVEEETEAALQRELSRESNPAPNEVMDLTRHDRPEEEPPGGRESVIKQQRLSLQASEGLNATGVTHHPIRALSRTHSSPLVTISPASSPQDHVPPGSSSCSNITALAYDALMNKHQCVCGSSSAIHPEHSGRIQSIWNRLQETRLVQKCLRVRSRKATLEELQSCHDEPYTLLFGTNPLYRQKVSPAQLVDLSFKSFVMLPCGGVGIDSDTTWNDLHTPSASRMATGCVIDLALKVASGEAKNGFAVVRPPGHHAEKSQAMGFCFFNSIAIAAKQLRLRLGLEKILVVDWDVHHGNGIQQIFYDDPHVLYISLHRHDDGNFFPGTGSLVECGSEDGMGFNVNIAWSGLQPPMGDAEYLAAFRAIVMPIAKDFQPEIVLVSAGFDAALGHPIPLGGYRVTPACFAYMTRQLMQLANGKIVMALEGGYDISSICASVEACVRSLLGEDMPPLTGEEISKPPCPSAIEVLTKAISIQTPHWPVIKQAARTIGLSAIEAARILGDRLPCEATIESEDTDTVSAMASLCVANTGQSDTENLSTMTSREQSEEPMDQDESK